MILFPYLVEKFNYFAKPDGQDPVTKVCALTSRGVMLGTAVGIYDAHLYSHCKTGAQYLNTIGYWVVPIAGMCVAFSSVTYMATNLRGKDDHYNYVLGALASGGVLQAWTKNPWTSIWGTIFLVAYATVKKDIKLNNYDHRMEDVFVPKTMDPPTVSYMRNLDRWHWIKVRRTHLQDYY